MYSMNFFLPRCAVLSLIARNSHTVPLPALQRTNDLKYLGAAHIHTYLERHFFLVEALDLHEVAASR